MTDRTPCCIPGCRRTFRADQVKDSIEIMCGRHFRTMDDRLRKRNKQLRKRMRKINRLVTLNAIQGRFCRRYTIDASEDRFVRLARKSWDACKVDATIKAVMGAEVCSLYAKKAA